MIRGQVIALSRAERHAASSAGLTSLRAAPSWPVLTPSTWQPAERPEIEPAGASSMTRPAGQEEERRRISRRTLAVTAR
jgi:hypothetical protein